MTKYLKHRHTGHVFIATPYIEGHEDLEPCEAPGADAAPVKDAAAPAEVKVVAAKKAAAKKAAKSPEAPAPETPAPTGDDLAEALGNLKVD